MNDAQRTMTERPTEEGGVWGSYVQYLRSLEAELKAAKAAIHPGEAHAGTVIRLQAENESLTATLDAIKERCREFSAPPVIGSDATDEERGFFDGHRLAHRQIAELAWQGAGRE